MTRTLTVADRLIPRDWQRSRVRFPAQVHDGYWVLHRLAGKARLLYFSAVHLKMISQIRIDYLVSLVGHVTPEVAPRTDVLALDVSLVPRMHRRMQDRAFGVHLP